MIARMRAWFADWRAHRAELRTLKLEAVELARAIACCPRCAEHVRALQTLARIRRWPEAVKIQTRLPYVPFIRCTNGSWQYRCERAEGHLAAYCRATTDDGSTLLWARKPAREARSCPRCHVNIGDRHEDDPTSHACSVPYVCRHCGDPVEAENNCCAPCADERGP